VSSALKYIDIFAGCGGLSLGLYNAGWQGIFAVEKNVDAFSTLKTNLIDNKNHFDWPVWLEIANHDIYDLIQRHRRELEALRGQVSLVVGGPPCQGFSMAGNRDADDVRNRLFGAYLKFIRLVQPDTLIFENVHGFTVAFSDENGEKDYAYSDKIITALKQEQYNVGSMLIDVSDYGVPQRRTRFILVASKKIAPKQFFDLLKNNCNKFLSERHLSARVSVEAAIGDLQHSYGTVACPDSPRFVSGVYGPIGSSYQAFMREGVTSLVPNSHRFAKHRKDTEDLFRRLIEYEDESKRYTPKTFLGLKKRGVTVWKRDSISTTVTSIPDDFVHFSEPRIPTVREVARIQSFPDWYIFQGKYTTGGERRKIDVPRYTQVANAVPPLFAEQLGLALKELLNHAGDFTF